MGEMDNKSAAEATGGNQKNMAIAMEVNFPVHTLQLVSKEDAAFLDAFRNCSEKDRYIVLYILGLVDLNAK